MKKSLLVLSSLLLAVQLFAQNTVTVGKDELLFEKAYMLHSLVRYPLYLDDEIEDYRDSIPARAELAAEIKETILDEAYEYYEELIDSFPRSKLKYRTLNNMGAIELALDYNEDALKTYKQILDSKADDKEDGGVGEGIMAEPYANYKNRAARVIASIYLEDSNYTEALKYLDLTQKYPYRHFCGNEYAANDIYMARQYARCYVGLGQYDSAISKLVPHLIENGLASNSSAVDILYKVLLKKYTKSELKKKLHDAFENYYTETIMDSDDEDKKYYYVMFLGHKLYIDMWGLYYLDTQPADKVEDKIKNKYTSLRLYRLLNGEVKVGS